MNLSKLTKIAFLTLGAVLLSYVTTNAQTGNTGGSSGGTGGGGSGLGSGPATTSPSAGGGTFTTNPDANPYAKDSFITESTSTIEKGSSVSQPRKHTTKTAKRTSRKTKKQSSPNPKASASPTASPTR